MVGARGAERVRLPGGGGSSRRCGSVKPSASSATSWRRSRSRCRCSTGRVQRHLTGAAYAATFVAPLVAGPAPAGLADRFARKPLMVTCLLLQMLCVSVIAIPWFRWLASWPV